MEDTPTAPAGAQTDDESTTTDGPTMTRRQFAAGAGATVAAVTMTGTAAAADDSGDWMTGSSGLNWDSPFVQNPYFSEGSLTRARHRMMWGTDDSALLTYEDDSGNKATLPGYVPREDSQNVLTLRADKIDFPGASAFPRGENYDESGNGDAETPVSALDAVHWTTDGATNGSISVSDGDLDVSQSLTISSSSVASGETVTATFSDVSLTDAAAKRFLQFVVNVDQLTSGATVEVVVVDDDGDEKTVSASAGADTSQDGVFASGTGSGIAYQQRLNGLSTAANGDGAFDSIDEIQVRITGADATLTFSAFDVERKSQWTFGSYLQNEGADSEERTTHYEPGPGTYSVTGLDTLGDVLANEDAVLYDVTQPMRYTLADSDGDFRFRFKEAANYPGYDYVLRQQGKASVPTAIDLTHSALSFEDVVSAPPNRYQAAWTALNTDGTALADLDDSDKTYHGSAYSSQGETATLRSSVTADNELAFGADILVTESNRGEAFSSSERSSGGGGAAPASNGGGGGNFLMFGGLFGLVGAVLGRIRGLW